MRKSFSNNNNEKTGSLTLSQPLFYIFQSVQSQPRPCELWLGPITGLIMGGSRFSLNNQGNSQTDRRSKLNGFQARLEEQIAWVGPSQSFWGNKTDLTQAGNYQNIHHFAPRSPPPNVPHLSVTGAIPSQRQEMPPERSGVCNISIPDGEWTSLICFLTVSGSSTVSLSTLLS